MSEMVLFIESMSKIWLADKDHGQNVYGCDIPLIEPKSYRDVLFEFHLKFWNTACIGIPARNLL